MVGNEPDLGRKIAEVKPKLIYIFLALLAGAILFLMGLYAALGALFQQMEIEWIGLIIAFLLFYLAAVLGLFAYRRYTASRTRYSLYEQGLQRQDGAEVQRMHWGRVKTVKREPRPISEGGELLNQSGRNRWRTWTLVAEDGQRLTISDQPRLASMVVGMILVYDWPALLGRIENGETIPLCGLLVSKEGLEYKGRLVPWSRIHKAKTKDHIQLDTTAGRIIWPEINNHDDQDVLSYLMLQRVIEYYILRK